eukprot:COSAG01_NODE_66922_length_268_cov_1.218935_2_plen_54_part_01
MTEIYLCNVCCSHEILRRNCRGQGGGVDKPGQSAGPGALPAAHGPWGSVSGYMV